MLVIIVFVVVLLNTRYSCFRSKDTVCMSDKNEVTVVYR